MLQMGKLSSILLREIRQSQKDNISFHLYEGLRMFKMPERGRTMEVFRDWGAGVIWSYCLKCIEDQFYRMRR